MAQPIRQIELSQGDKELLRQEAKRTKPVEACGLLTGRAEQGSARVSRVHLTPNLEGSPSRFTVEPELLLRVIMEAERLGDELVAIFHSHNGRASPSEYDAPFMQLNPLVWLIYSNETDCFEAFQWQEGSVRKVGIHARPSDSPRILG